MAKKFITTALLLLVKVVPCRCTTYPSIAGYEPLTYVEDQAAIDLDQREMEKWLEAPVEVFQQAERIYSQGAFSDSIARLRLVNAEPPLKPLPSGSLVYGTANSGVGIQGRLIQDTTWESKDKEVFMLVQYDREKNSAHGAFCEVGALARTQSAVIDGCFMKEGSIQVLQYSRNTPAYSYSYVYDIEQDNFNGRTIQGFSTDGFAQMYNCTTCPYEAFNKFVEYYGSFDYGNQVVVAALNSRATSFHNGNLDFTEKEKHSRGEAAKIASKFLNIWMYVIRMMDYALDRCELPCQKSADVLYSSAQKAQCDDSPVRAWDSAVAYYAGSLEGDSGDGVLFFDLADKMCVNFLACGREAELRFGVSYVNNLAINEFMNGQAHLLKRECAAARESKDKIEKMMAVPLIQATLLNTYEQIYGAWRAPAEDSHLAVQGATYAATVLPLVHHCNPGDAEIIYQNLHFDPVANQTWTPNYNAVKAAFERNYYCMGITCKAVGGIWKDGAYSPHAAPCQDAQKVKKSAERPFRISLSAIVAGIACILGGLLYLNRQQRSREGIETSPVYDREPSHIPDDNLRASHTFD